MPVGLAEQFLDRGLPDLFVNKKKEKKRKEEKRREENNKTKTACRGIHYIVFDPNS